MRTIDLDATVHRVMCVLSTERFSRPNIPCMLLAPIEPYFRSLCQMDGEKRKSWLSTLQFHSPLLISVVSLDGRTAGKNIQVTPAIRLAFLETRGFHSSFRPPSLLVERQSAMSITRHGMRRLVQLPLTCCLRVAVSEDSAVRQFPLIDSMIATIYTTARCKSEKAPGVGSTTKHPQMGTSDCKSGGGATTVEYEVWRMDTHGNEAMDGWFTSLDQATKRVVELEGDVQHKQHYFIREVKVRP